MGKNALTVENTIIMLKFVEANQNKTTNHSSQFLTAGHKKNLIIRRLAHSDSECDNEYLYPIQCNITARPSAKITVLVYH